jgi:hypothetical protein
VTALADSERELGERLRSLGFYWNHYSATTPTGCYVYMESLHSADHSAHHIAHGNSLTEALEAAIAWWVGGCNA